MPSSLMRLLARRLGLSLLLMATGSALGSEDELQPLRNVLDPILESTMHGRQCCKPVGVHAQYHAIVRSSEK